MERNVIGKISATSNEHTTSDYFSFWLRPEVIVNPFDIVEVEQLSYDGQSTTYGVVNVLEHITDSSSHLSNFISNDFGEIATEPNTVRQGTTIARAFVLSNDKDIYMPVQNDMPVRFASSDGIRKALGIDKIPEAEQIPAGVIKMSNGSEAVVYLDRRYVLGPEGAHVNITGISGLATKTSYIMFLIQSILQSSKGTELDGKITVIILNVKHGDLLSIDQPSVQPIDEDQRRLWNLLGLEPKPFENVTYLLPHSRDEEGIPNSFRVPPGGNYKIYAYSLADTYNKLDLLLSNVPDPWDTIGAIVGEISQGLADVRSGLFGPVGEWAKVKTWHNLLNDPPLFQNGVPQTYREIRSTSIGRFKRILRRIIETRQSGIFVQQRSSRVVSIEEEISKIKGGEVIVVDIARLTDDEQTLVFGDILRTVYELYAERAEVSNDLPKKVIIFVDELNKYAPSFGKDSPILEQVLDISERGRSLGVILFGAEQFMSAVHERVAGNCSTFVVGRSSAAELSAVHYRFVDPAVRANITRLDKGQLILSHPVFRQPVKIIFPRPVYLQEGST